MHGPLDFATGLLHLTCASLRIHWETRRTQSVGKEYAHLGSIDRSDITVSRVLENLEIVNELQGWARRVMLADMGTEADREGHWQHVCPWCAWAAGPPFSSQVGFRWRFGDSQKVRGLDKSWCFYMQGIMKGSWEINYTSTYDKISRTVAKRREGEKI